MDERVTVDVRRSLQRAVEGPGAEGRRAGGRFIALALAEKVGSVRAAEFFAERGQGADAERAAAWLEARAEAG